MAKAPETSLRKSRPSRFPHCLPAGVLGRHSPRGSCYLLVWSRVVQNREGTGGAEATRKELPMHRDLAFPGVYVGCACMCKCACISPCWPSLPVLTPLPKQRNRPSCRAQTGTGALSCSFSLSRDVEGLVVGAIVVIAKIKKKKNCICVCAT